MGLFHLTFPTINATHSVKQLASLQAWQLVDGGVPDVIFSEVNCSRRNPADTGTCWGFARASGDSPVPVQGTPLGHPHCWSPSESPVSPTPPPQHRYPEDFRVLKEQTSTWAFNVLLPSSSDFCWLLQSWLWACCLLVQITTAAQENNLKSPGNLEKMLILIAALCQFCHVFHFCWKETTQENTEELSAAPTTPCSCLLPRNAPQQSYPVLSGGVNVGHKNCYSK